MLYSILIDHIYHLKNDINFTSDSELVTTYWDLSENFFIFSLSCCYDLLLIKKIENINDSKYH
jgi:hypothetical protein